ncbi:hemolysin-coregulated protein [Enterobacter cancerogenus]|uniref:Hemolysin-coregulated protein n=1 Tax=Enterobacter cancerogenus TaxID=69218 RepID=A0A484Z870_9ENTR|nr:hemolysin-coregulated protein [Enterobacter cancerogenus]
MMQESKENISTLSLENVKITGITPNLFPRVLEQERHTETIELRYEAITWKHCDGNIVYKDAWNHLAIA